MANFMEKPEVVWHSSQRQGKVLMEEYRRHINRHYKQNLRDTASLHQWSVAHPHDFWIDLYKFLEIIPALPPMITKAYDDTAPMSSIPTFFSGAEINYAENVLFANPNPNAPALIGLREGQDVYRENGQVLTWKEFRESTREAASALVRSGIKKGDRVAALMATSADVVILFHAAAAIGAVFTAISPELGVQGCVSRLDQVSPSILFIDSHTVYKGKMLPTAEKLQQLLLGLSIRPSVYIVPVGSDHNQEFPTWGDFIKKSGASDKLQFTRVPFNHPLFIAYSSGTTGTPKCIVRHHGVIMQMKKNTMLHNCVSRDDVIMQYSSTSWVLFYGMCGQLSAGAAVILYNGSALFPDAKQLLRVCERYKVTFLAVSPRLLFEIETSHTVPKIEFDLSTLKTIQSTGAPLSLEQYRWFYRAFPTDVQLCNTAGSTDVASTFIAMDPCGSIHAGEMQVLSLGMDVDVADPLTGDSIMHTGEAGELVIRQPFPSMPCFFWGDTSGTYKAAYFERFENIDVWAMHDWLRKNPSTGGYIVHGRSDGVLNPSGIRFGSGEIYNVVEKRPFNDLFTNTLCVGRRRPQDSDEQVFLFVVMKPGAVLSQELRNQVKAAIREALSPRHVPKYLLDVPDIPMTINGKKIELAVKKIISGTDVKPTATVENPDALDWFYRFRTLEREAQEGARL